jgi:hypothetical protein
VPIILACVATVKCTCPTVRVSFFGTEANWDMLDLNQNTYAGPLPEFSHHATSFKPDTAILLPASS